MKKINLLMTVLMITSTFSAQAFFEPIEDVSEITIEKPNLICESKDVEEELDDLVLFIDVAGRRVAQAGQDALKEKAYTGLMIDVDRFAVSRCPHCYSIVGKHLGSEVKINTQGTSFTTATGTYTFGDLVINMKCKTEL